MPGSGCEGSEHDYESDLGAILAATEWDGDGEPMGWHRHPSTGRRRPEGDPEMEYVNP